jgi:hypothetical protein
VQHRYAEYRPAAPWHRLRRRFPGFRSVRPVVVGWTALSLGSGGLGYAGSRLSDVSAALGLVGGAVAVATALLMFDRRRRAQLRDRGATNR